MKRERDDNLSGSCSEGKSYADDETTDSIGEAEAVGSDRSELADDQRSDHKSDDELIIWAKTFLEEQNVRDEKKSETLLEEASKLIFRRAAPRSRDRMRRRNRQ